MAKEYLQILQNYNTDHLPNRLYGIHASINGYKSA